MEAIAKQPMKLDKKSNLRLLLTVLSLTVSLRAVEKGEELTDASDPVLYEYNQCQTLRNGVKLNRKASMEGLLNVAATGRDKFRGQSAVAVARRAVVVCGWLRSENEYGKADDLANFAIKLLDKLKLSDPAAVVERNYWQAVLLGEFLDRKKDALSYIEEAKELAPDDERFPSLQISYQNALDSDRR